MSRWIHQDPDKVRGQIRKQHRRRFWQNLGLIVFVAFAAIYVMVRWSGFWLVSQDSWTHVPWVVVLEGQTADLERTDFAAGLLADGRADSALVLGRRVLRNRNNVDFYLPEMLKQGAVDAGRIFLVRHDDPSTLEEARTVIPILKQRGVDTVLLLTRGPATRRAKRIFQKLAGPSIVVLAQDVPDPAYDPRTWAQTREGRKVWLQEWMAFLVASLELLGAKPLEPLPGKQYPVEWAGRERENTQLVPVMAEEPVHQQED